MAKPFQQSLVFGSERRASAFVRALAPFSPLGRQPTSVSRARVCNQPGDEEAFWIDGA